MMSPEVSPDISLATTQEKPKDDDPWIDFREQFKDNLPGSVAGQLQAMEDMERKVEERPFFPGINPLTGQPNEMNAEEDIVDAFSSNISYSMMFNKPLKEVESMMPAYKARVDADGNFKKIHTDLVSTMGANIRVAREVSRANRLYVKASLLGSGPEYERLKVEAQMHIDKGTKIGADYATRNDATFFNKLGNTLGVVYGGVEKSLQTATVAGTSTGVSAAAVSSLSGPGALPAFAGGFSTGFTISMFGQSQEEAQGMIYGDAIRRGIPHEEALKYAVLGSIPHATMETFALGKMTKRVFLTAMANKPIRIGGAIFEGTGTNVLAETLQGGMEVSAVVQAATAATERTGKEYKTYSVQQLVSKMKEGFEEGLYGGLGTSTVSAVSGAAVGAALGKDTTSDAVGAVNNLADEYEGKVLLQQVMQSLEAQDRLEELNRAENPGQNVDPLTNEVSEPAPFTPQELEKTGKESGVVGTEITEDNVDRFNMDDTASPQELIQKVKDSISPKSTAFSNDLRTVLPNEREARAIESLIAARADSLGISYDQYMDRRGISLKEGKEGTGQNAQVEFISENKTLITAFQGADVFSIAHEVGHIFRRDLNPRQMSALNSWVGLEDGAVWSVKQEEQFARAFEKYLASGKAPTEGLKKVFQNFANWMVKTYRAIKGSMIDVQMTPEVRNVMDEMLGKTETVERTYNEGPSLLEQRDKPKPEFEKIVNEQEYIATAKERVKEILESGLTNERMYEESIAHLAKVARDYQARGDQRGYNRAKTQMKALLKRMKEDMRLANRHDMAIKQLKGVLKSNRPKKVNGQPISKLDADTNDILDMLRGRLSEITSREKALDALTDDGLNFFWGDEGISDKNRMERLLLTALAGKDEQALGSLLTMLKMVRDTVKGGKDNAFTTKLKKWKLENVPKILDDIEGADRLTGAVPFLETPPVDENKSKMSAEEIYRAKTRIEKMKTGTLGKDLIYGLRGLLEIASQKSPAGADMKSHLNTIFETFDADQARLTEVRERIAMMEEKIGDAFFPGEKASHTTLINKINENNTTMRKVAGVGYTVDELMTFWAQIKNELNRNRHMNTRGGLKFMEDLSDALTQEEKQYADSLQELVSEKDYVLGIDEVHRNQFGVSMAQREGYFPVSSAGRGELDKIDVTDIFQRDNHSYSNANTGHTKEVVAGAHDRIKVEGITSVYLRYTEEMAHFKHYADLVTKMNTVFRNTPEVKNAITKLYGPDFYRLVLQGVDDVAKDGRNQSMSIAWADNFRNGFVKTAVSASSGVFFKQMISTVNYMENMPAADYALYMTKFMANPVSNAKSMTDIDYFKNRWRGGIDRDFKTTAFADAQKSANSKIGKKAGDMAYRQYLMDKKGMTKAEANREVGFVSEQSQQSGSTAEQSQIQRNKQFLVKAATMFSSGPVQAQRKVIGAVRGMINGRVSYAKGTKALFIYQFLVPAMYSVVTNLLMSMAGDDKELEDYISGIMWSAAFGPTSSIYNAGRSFARSASIAAGVSAYPTESPFDQTLRAMFKVPKYMYEGKAYKLDPDDWSRAMEAALILSGKGGIPVTKLQRTARGVVEGDAALGLGLKPKY